MSGLKCSDALRISGAGLVVNAIWRWVTWPSGHCEPALLAAMTLRLSLQAVPAKGDRHRNRKKWRPQRAHRNGERIQVSDFSRALRIPTALNSIDLQYGQCGGDIDFITLNVGLRRTARSASWTIAETARGHVCACSLVSAACWAARFPGGPNLLRRPQVRLRKFRVVFRAGNLALMSL